MWNPRLASNPPPHDLHGSSLSKTRKCSISRPSGTAQLASRERVNDLAGTEGPRQVARSWSNLANAASTIAQSTQPHTQLIALVAQIRPRLSPRILAVSFFVSRSSV